MDTQSVMFELLFSLLYDILCVLCFLPCMFLLYVTVLLPVGVIKDDDKLDRGRSIKLKIRPCFDARPL